VIEDWTKPWPDYLLEALGLGLAFGAVGVALVEWFGSGTVEAGLTWGLVGLLLGGGLRLNSGRTASRVKARGGGKG